MLAPPESQEDLKRIITQQQIHYSDFVQKVIKLLELDGKTNESEAVKQLAEHYGLTTSKIGVETNKYGHLTIDSLYYMIIKLLKSGDLRAEELRTRIGRNRIYPPTYYKAIKDLLSKKEISKFGYGSGIIYSLNENNHEKAS
jgi:hypothetical protein